MNDLEGFQRKGKYYMSAQGSEKGSFCWRAYKFCAHTHTHSHTHGGTKVSTGNHCAMAERVSKCWRSRKMHVCWKPGFCFWACNRGSIFVLSLCSPYRAMIQSKHSIDRMLTNWSLQPLAQSAAWAITVPTSPFLSPHPLLPRFLRNRLCAQWIISGLWSLHKS